MIWAVFQKVNETPMDIEKKYRNNIESDYVIETGKGKMIIGGAGCGKTTRLIEDATKSKNPIIFSFTNQSVSDIRNRLPVDMKDRVHTFDSYFNEYASDVENLA